MNSRQPSTIPKSSFLFDLDKTNLMVCCGVNAPPIPNPVELKLSEC